MKLFALLVTALLAACSPKPPTIPRTVREETAATPAERVAAISRLLQQHGPVPGTLTDAHFLEEQVGDGRLGPSDFFAFFTLEVAPADLPTWRAALGEREAGKPLYAKPTDPRAWWVSENDFGSLEFYSPKPLAGREQGWVGVDAKTGKIFVYAYSM